MKISNDNSIAKVTSENGFSLVELLVTTILSSLVIMGASTLYFNSITNYHDRRIKAEAEETAQLILNMMANDIKMIGNGLPNLAQWTEDHDEAVPLDQYNSDSDTITMRLSRTGEVDVNSVDVTPNVSGFTITVLNNIFEPGDRIYMNSSTVGDEYGLMGYVASIAGNVLTIEGNSNADTASSFSPSASFKDGSLIYNIPFVQYDSPGDWSGITMSVDYLGTDMPSSAVIMAPNTTFEVEYLQSDLNTISQMKAESIMSELALVKITVFARGNKPLTNGTTYETWAQKYVSPRYMVLHRQQHWY